ncbi:membrane protein insertion efficiency factor YidD [Pedobacter rhodius]|uniref:membrane protein insertion efficiency factor YidD n=1 Tax=Pedobacter rhodius TaxID=3004098 RepID=UPI003D169F42
MNILLLLIIKLYWAIFPKDKRRKCIFRISCSKYVYQVTKKEGLLKGLTALKYRYQNCRNGFHLFKNHVDDGMMMILPGGGLLLEGEISERFIKV